MALTKSKIEYLTHCWNFYEGCLNSKEVCPVRDSCWARKCAKMARLADKEFKPHLLVERLLDPLKGYNPKKPRRIGVCFTGDLFGNWVDPKHKLDLPLPSGIGTIGVSLKVHVLTTIKQCPADTFIFLTKRPQNLRKWSPFPDNCWVGVSAIDTRRSLDACLRLGDIECSLRCVSIEPMLNPINLPFELLNRCKIGWLIIGQQTPASEETAPQIPWIKEIVDAADKAGVAVFLKNNLYTLLAIFGENHWAFEYNQGCQRYELRQEFPTVV